MSNIKLNIIDPTGAPAVSPDVIVPAVDPDDEVVGNDAIREPDTETPPVEPDPEESNSSSPSIHTAGATKG